MGINPRTLGGVMIVVGVGSAILTLRQQQLQRQQDAAEAAAEAATAAAAAARTKAATPLIQVISLFSGQALPGEPLGVHVADVTIDTAGVAGLSLADNATTKASVEAALAQARAQPGLMVLTSSAAATSLADFLGTRTGFKTQLQSR